RSDGGVLPAPRAWRRAVAWKPLFTLSFRTALPLARGRSTSPRVILGACGPDRTKSYDRDVNSSGIGAGVLSTFLDVSAIEISRITFSSMPATQLYASHDLSIHVPRVALCRAAYGCRVPRSAGGAGPSHVGGVAAAGHAPAPHPLPRRQSQRDHPARP